MTPANRYSPEWFARFPQRIPPEQTRREVAFVDGQLEPGSFLLDLPCGAGRHAAPLAAAGHRVLAADRETTLLGSIAEPLEPLLQWIAADMRALPLAPGRLDAIVCLWQSFGYFESAENARVLEHWRALVRPGGRLVLDMYHRAFFERHQGERQPDHDGERVCETKALHGDRLVVDLAYERTGHQERFDWQVFAPDDFTTFAARCGWVLRLACSGFDAGLRPDPERSRVQYVLERPAARGHP